MHIIIGIMFLVSTNFVFANGSSLNLQLPSAPQSYSSDKFRAGDLDCSNAIGGATNIEFGVTGILDNYSSPFDGGGDTTKDVGVYARIIIPLDAPKERINCNSLYQIELRKRRIEVLRLQEELEQLRMLNRSGAGGFEN